MMDTDAFFEKFKKKEELILRALYPNRNDTSTALYRAKHQFKVKVKNELLTTRDLRILKHITGLSYNQLIDFPEVGDDFADFNDIDTLLTRGIHKNVVYIFDPRVMRLSFHSPDFEKDYATYPVQMGISIIEIVKQAKLLIENKKHYYAFK